jgi:hypothetical protein
VRAAAGRAPLGRGERECTGRGREVKGSRRSVAKQNRKWQSSLRGNLNAAVLLRRHFHPAVS